MTRNKYIVVFHDREWRIQHNGELSARYRSQEEALLDALNAARRVDMRGQDAEVLVRGPGLRFRTEWTNRLEREAAPSLGTQLLLPGIDTEQEQSDHEL